MKFLKHLNIPEYLDGKVQLIIRCAIVVGIFVAIIPLQGNIGSREGQQIIFMLAMISLFSLLLRNIWVTMFILWSVFLFSFFKFDTGQIYISNLFMGGMLYFVTKIGFKRKHINIFINGFLWFVFVNIAYAVLQISGYDFIYSTSYIDHVFTFQRENINPTGFMNHVSSFSFLIAGAIPLLATRGTKIGWVGAVGLLIPLYIAKTSLCFIMGVFGLLFVIAFKVPKKALIVFSIISILGCFLYVTKVDFFGGTRTTQWYQAMSDAVIHPVTGWGLDSYRNITKQKDFKYKGY